MAASLPTLTFPAKAIRARVIAAYARAAGYRGVVVFSCGNASRALKATGIYTVEVAPGGDLVAGRWWQPAEIHRAWPDLLDATSGHLPAPLMMDLARAYRGYLGDLPQKAYEVPTGSGETILCLSWAYPDVAFMPVYSDDPATMYDSDAPLNSAVAALVARHGAKV